MKQTREKNIFIFELRFVIFAKEQIMARNLRQDIIERHEKAHFKLKVAALPFFFIFNVTLAYKKVGRNIGCSHITIANYVQGDYKDGFLTEAITKEFKKLKL